MLLIRQLSNSFEEARAIGELADAVESSKQKSGADYLARDAWHTLMCLLDDKVAEHSDRVDEISYILRSVE